MVKGAVFLALIVLATGCRHKDEPLKPLVIVDKPAKEDVQIFGEYVGRIRAARFVEIHARVEGYLEKMLFVEGKEVKQNEPLFIINSALYKAKVVLYTNRMQPASWTWIMPLPLTKVLKRT